MMPRWSTTWIYLALLAISLRLVENFPLPRCLVLLEGSFFIIFSPLKLIYFSSPLSQPLPPQAGGAPICAYDIPHKTFSQKNSQESIPSDMDHLWSITLVMTCLDMPSALGLV